MSGLLGELRPGEGDSVRSESAGVLGYDVRVMVVVSLESWRACVAVCGRDEGDDGDGERLESCCCCCCCCCCGGGGGGGGGSDGVHW